MSKSRMWSFALGLCAVAITGLSARASLVTGTGTASTSNKGTVSTTTTGQKQILAGIDPFGTYSFQLDYSFEVGKAQFLGLNGVNGYVIDSFDLSGLANGLIQDIKGHYDPFFDGPGGETFLTSGEGPTVNGIANPIPPQQEIDIFEILFADLAPQLEKKFLVFAGNNLDFIQGMDANGNLIPPAVGPGGVQSALLIIPGNAPDGVYPGVSVPGGPGPNVPLPAALPIGLVAGAGILLKKHRRAA